MINRLVLNSIFIGTDSESVFLVAYSLRPNQISFFGCLSFIYIFKITIFYNIKHYYTHYILILSLLYNNKNTITPTTLLHCLDFISIKKYVSPTTLLTFHLTLFIFYTFFWSPTLHI